MYIKNDEIPKTIIFGSNGYIGSYLLDCYKLIDESTIGFNRHSSPTFDLIDSTSWEFDLRAKYGIVCVGITKISKCESDPVGTEFVNVQQTYKLVEHLVKLEIIPIVFSSDYVFDGVEGNYTELSKTKAVNEYGKQKQLLEEKILRDFSDKCIILRLSKVYGDKGSFISEIIDLFMLNKSVKVATDQIFCPIHLKDVFKAIVHIQKERLTGLFNLCGPEAFPRDTIADLIASKFNFNKSLIHKISLKNLGENFQRPFNTTMESVRLNLKKFSSLKDNIEKLLKNYERKKPVG